MTATIIGTFFLFAGLLGMSCTITWVIRKGCNNAVTRLFAGCQLSIIIWLVSQLLILFSCELYQYRISYFIGNIGISLFAPLWLMFTAEFSNIGKKPIKALRSLFIITIAAVTVIITNPIHKLYYSVFDVKHVEYGILFYVFQVIYYICVLTGIVIMFIKYSRVYNQNTKQAILLSLSTAVPLAVNTLNLMHVFHTEIELMPLFFAFSSIMLLIALHRYGFLDINNIAINDTIDNIKSGVLVFDSRMRITYRNKAADSLLDISMCHDFDGFISRITEISDFSPKDDLTTAEFRSGDSFFNLEYSVCTDKKGKKVAGIITFSDVTQYHELAAAEKKLSIEQERNRIAQEMHDSAGHTFTMISSLSRIVLYELGRENPDISVISGHINDIDAHSRSGVTQLRCSINNLREDEFMTSISRAVRTVTDAVRGVEVNLSFQGEENDSYSPYIRCVYDSTRETVTNAMRYSDASRIDIIIKFLGKSLEIYILDNGKGCSDIKENNGLRGIRERTEQVGGTVRFMSVPDEGFTTIIKIPLKMEEQK